jgi:hypothetical protein
VPADHHSEYLARAVVRLTPEGHERVDQLLDGLVQSAGLRPSLVEFARARRVEADLGRTDLSPVEEPKLTEPELNALLAGFMTIRDTEHLDDVADWANAVIALLEDETGYEGVI